MKKSLLVATMLAAVAAAHAGPLDSLMYSVRGLANTAQQIGGVAPGSPAAAPQMQFSQDVQGIISSLKSEDQTGLKKNYDASDYLCNELRKPANVEPFAAIQTRFNRGEYSYAATAARDRANFMAVCASFGRQMSSDDLSQIGSLLAISAFSRDAQGIRGAMPTWEAKAALTLLQQNPDANKNLIAQIESSGLVPVVVKVADQADRVDLGTLLDKFKSNQFGFFRLYENKTVSTVAVLQEVKGDANGAALTLGTGKKNEIPALCLIQDPASLDAAANAAQGEKVEVKGVVKKDRAIQQVLLQDCRVIPQQK